ncbi:MAG: hypothetical protein HGB01_04960 [Chlorobiaceae bacterium]|nr:hypothetical protein [Chlorobiaceae bacterium]
MENQNFRVILFTFLSFASLTLVSLFSESIARFWPQVVNIDILSDIRSARARTMPDSSASHLASGDSVAVAPSDTSNFHFAQYLQPGQIVNFRDRDPNPSLLGTMGKLAALRRGEKVKLRIAWFGDSLIEGDLITQTLRELLQNDFGGRYGVGFVPFRSVTAGFRTSATATSRGSWREVSFRDAKAGAPLFFSGHLFYSGGGDFELRDNTVKDSSQVVQKWLLCGRSTSPVQVAVNGRMQYIDAPGRFNRILLDSSAGNRIRVRVPAGSLPLYGVSSEPEYGVVVDNFSFRGISGFELAKLDDELLDDISRSGQYDLVVIQYGVNVMFRSRDTNYDYYFRGMSPVVRRLRERMPDSEFLLVSCSDRAFRYGTEWKTAIGLDSLLQVQARIAYDNRITFFNLYQSMGGNGTIVRWAEDEPRLAAKDYIHASPRGASLLGRHLFDAFMKDYTKLTPEKPRR